MNRPLFSHVPLAMASCPQLLACQTLYGKNTLLEEYTFPCCAQGRFSRNVLPKEFTRTVGGNPTIVLQLWVAETTLGNALELIPPHPPALRGDPDPDSNCVAQTPSACYSGCAESGQSSRLLLTHIPPPHTHTPENKRFGAQSRLTKVKQEFTNFNYYRV